MEAFLTAFDALPEGASDGRFEGRRYILSKSLHAGGASQKLVARAVDGTDYISLNLYRLRGGRALLRPCEMPERKVCDFVLGLVRDQ
ncbi:hypothetical protein [Profundibacterium mesophilum]|uniref:Peptide methionine sulfoxide reductase n=1 Tax=Profundibacterium mesophilum KAUST100406-0324 TaxID=1037889 RepID=A0A921NUT3_9RHOB|nr:hypothetical protein [Profundibacterium mesophilum]KAF0675978.1 hypothetical protein PMES_01733 [Profundibacterium mesophilum KAUST100406-0324]